MDPNSGGVVAEGAHRYTIRDVAEARALIRRRYPQFAHVEMLCNWIMDTLEAGDQYKYASYRPNWAFGATGNLIRHRREWPLSGMNSWEIPGTEWDYTAIDDPMRDPGRRKIDMYNQASEQAYHLRLMRTPTPTKFREIITKLVEQIYRQTPRRAIKDVASDAVVPPSGSVQSVQAWWMDVDGRGTNINAWMRETVAPLLAALGMLDIYCDHPSFENEPSLQMPGPMEEWIYGGAAGGMADVVGTLGTGGMPAYDVGEAAGGGSAGPGEPAATERCVAQYILPQNVLWFRLDYTGRYYREVLIREYRTRPPGDASPPGRRPAGPPGVETIEEVFRHWTAAGWTLYDPDGRVLAEGEHPFGRVPIVRIFDRQHYRIPHAGDPRFKGIVERCREFFNEESELIYAIDLQCFSFLQAPPLGTDEDGYQVPMGPGMLAYKVKTDTGYEGYEYVAPDVSPLDFMAHRLQWLIDEMDGEGGLSRPSTAVSIKSGATYPASGIAKAFDQEEGSNILAGLAMSLESAEREMSRAAATVLLDRRPTTEEAQRIEIGYNLQFNLLRYDEMDVMSKAFLDFRDRCGYIPEVEVRILQWMAEYLVRGVDPAARELVNKQIREFVDDKVKSVKEALAAPPPAAPPGSPEPPPGTQVVVKRGLEAA